MRTVRLSISLFFFILTGCLLCPKFIFASASLGPWSLTSAMNSPRFYHASVAVGNYIYVIGGADDVSHIATVERAAVNPDGSLGAWTAMPSMTIPRLSPAAVSYGNYIYVSGGEQFDSGGPVDSVERTQVNPDGSLENWEVVSHMNSARELHGSIIANGYLYVIGGYTGAGPKEKSVEKSKIMSDGLLGIWETDQSLGAERSAFVSIFNNDSIYAVGGNSNFELSSVEKTKINNDSSLNTWTYTNSLIKNREFLGAVILNNNIFAVGGSDSCSLKTVEQSSINLDGSLFGWSESNSMTIDRKGLGLVTVNGNIYATGGGRECGSSDILNSVEWAHVDGLPGLNPVVFVPGMTASWSQKGLVDNQPTTYSDWQLIPGSDYYYKPIFDTLSSAGLTMDQTMFEFAYDWTSQISQNATSLNSFLQNEVLPKNGGKKANIISHSMGGLITAYCFEKIAGCSDKINKIITAGSPFQGAVDAYPLWEGGKIEEANVLKKLLFNVLLDRRSSPDFNSTVSLIHAKAKGLGDIMPIFNYINEKPYETMSSIGRNLTLESMFNPSFTFKNSLTTLWGNSKETTRSLNVVTPDQWEKNEGLWPDGKPVSKYFTNGDNSVLDFSANLIGASDNLQYDGLHTEYFRDTATLSKMLSTFGLSGSPIVFPASQIDSVLLFFLHSPANLIVKDSSGHAVGTTDQSGKAVWIFNPVIDVYNAEITGTGNGDFGIEAIFAKNSDNTVIRKIDSTIISGQTKNYFFDYTGENKSTFINSSNDFLQSFKIHTFQSKNKRANVISKNVEKLLIDLKTNPAKSAVILNIRSNYFDLINILKQDKTNEGRFYLKIASDDLFNLLVELDKQYGPDGIRIQANNLLNVAETLINKLKININLSSPNLDNLRFAISQLEKSKNYFSSSNLYQSYLLSNSSIILIR